MRRFLVRFSESEASNHTPSLADFTITTPELKFSVHTRVRSIEFRGASVGLRWHPAFALTTWLRADRKSKAIGDGSHLSRLMRLGDVVLDASLLEPAATHCRVSRPLQPTVPHHVTMLGRRKMIYVNHARTLARQRRGAS